VQSLECRHAPHTISNEIDVWEFSLPRCIAKCPKGGIGGVRITIGRKLAAIKRGMEICRVVLRPKFAISLTKVTFYPSLSFKIQLLLGNHD